MWRNKKKEKKETEHGIPFELKGEILILMPEQMPDVGWKVEYPDLLIYHQLPETDKEEVKNGKQAGTARHIAVKSVLSVPSQWSG